MYKYKLMDNEDVIEIFDKLYVKQGNNEKTTSVILTNKRLLFLDYLVPDEMKNIPQNLYCDKFEAISIATDFLQDNSII